MFTSFDTLYNYKQVIFNLVNIVVHNLGILYTVHVVRAIVLYGVRRKILLIMAISSYYKLMLVCV